MAKERLTMDEFIAKVSEDNPDFAEAMQELSRLKFEIEIDEDDDELGCIVFKKDEEDEDI